MISPIFKSGGTNLSILAMIVRWGTPEVKLGRVIRAAAKDLAVILPQFAWVTS
jgi:hypothetical protein